MLLSMVPSAVLGSAHVSIVDLSESFVELVLPLMSSVGPRSSVDIGRCAGVLVVRLTKLAFSFILYITSDFSLLDYLCSPVLCMRSLIRLGSLYGSVGSFSTSCCSKFAHYLIITLFLACGRITASTICGRLSIF